MTGGELYSKIRQLKTYTERDVACIVRQIMSAVYYMHQNSVCHRDLKPENLLCEGTGDEIHIKIADFGISRMYKVGQDMSTVCGSPEYVGLLHCTFVCCRLLVCLVHKCVFVCACNSARDAAAEAVLARSGQLERRRRHLHPVCAPPSSAALLPTSHW